MRPPKEPTPPEYAARRNAERRAERRVLGPALLASALIHIALLLLFTFRLEPDPYTAGRPPQRVLSIEPAMRAYDIATVMVEAAPIEVQIEERRRAAEQESPARAPGVATPQAPVSADTPDQRRELGARDRLQYRMGAAEVWRPQAPLPPVELSDDELVQRRIAAQLGEYNDSVAGEAAARKRSTDWTVKGEDGKRWGVSPGQVHLGNVTLPLPFQLLPSREVAGRVRDWNELQQQAARVEGSEIFDDRVRAIRERADQERARKSTTTSSGTDGGTGGR